VLKSCNDKIKENESVVVMCLGQGADLHMAQLMPLTLTVSCFSKIQIGSGTGCPG